MQSVYKDITIKARLINADLTEKIIQSLNAQYIGKDLQTDHYFETPKGKLKWREGTIENLITHYERIIDHEVEQTIVYRYDLNPLKDMIDDLLLNYKSIGVIQKERKIYKMDNIKIHIDKLPNKEEFIEIEAIDSENRFTLEELKAQCQSLKKELKIDDSDLIATGYLKNIMSKEQTKDLLKFLKPFPDETEIVMWLREFVWDLYPKANELIYDNYNALAFGWSPTDKVGHVFCSIAVGRTSKNIHFGFYWGSELADPEKKLIGEGKQYRYILVKSIKEFPKAYIKKLLSEAYANSFAKVKDPKQLKEGLTITKSISPVKRTKKGVTKKKAPKKKVVAIKNLTKGKSKK